MNAKFLSLALLFILASPVHALTPASGVWWNPNLSGSGFEIDLQAQTMVLTAFSYDASGAPLWYLVPGQYDDSTNTFTGAGNTFTGGQCLGCEYSAPVAAPAGDFSLTFSDAEHATVTFPGGHYPIEHFVYGVANKLDYLLGEWVFTMNGSSAAAAPGGGTQWIIFDSHTFGTPNGTVLVTGHGDGNNDLAYASYDAATNAFYVSVSSIAADESITSVAYRLSGDDRRMTGAVLPFSSVPDTTRVAAFRLSY